MSVLWIDFESLPDGSAAQSGMKISDQFEEDYGITFARGNGQAATIAKRGGATEAFGSHDNIVGYDQDETGDYFLTDDGVISGSSATMVMDLTIAANALHGLILDVDFEDCWHIAAYDEVGGLVSEIVLAAGAPGTGNGRAAGFTISDPNGFNSIARIEFVGTTNVTMGFAFDQIGIERVGTDGDNHIIGSEDSDVISGLDSDDLLEGRGGDDYLFGGSGKDVLIDGAGEDDMKGGGKPDEFIFVADNETDRILDFKQGADVMDISAWDISFDDLRIRDKASGAVKIKYLDEIILLKNSDGALSAATIEEADFIF